MKRHRRVPGPSPSSALERSLRRTLRKQKTACRELESEEAIHDVRVALRRCRSLAEGFSDLDAHLVWRRLSKLCKTQQRGLADLRDAQIMLDWIRKLRLTNGKSGAALVAALEKEERQGLRKAGKTLKAFPRKRWKKWLHQLPERAELVPLSESRLAALALERLTEAQDLARHWGAARSPQAWHKLRIAVKRYRYTTESFLPEEHAAWSRGLQALQDVLGEGHDLDVLRAKILELSGTERMDSLVKRSWLKIIDGARLERVRRYERAVSLQPPSGKQATGARLSGPNQGKSRPRPPTASRTLWDRWRAGLEPLALLPHS